MRISKRRLRQIIQETIRSELIEQSSKETLEDMEHPSDEGKALLQKRLKQLDWMASDANLDSYLGMPGYDPRDEAAHVKEKREFLKDTYGDAYTDLPW